MSKLDWQLIANQLNDHLEGERISSQMVANRAGVDRKTIERLRAGQAVRPQTLQWIEQALKIELGPAKQLHVDPAAGHFGGYQRDTVANYIGEYTAYRRSFDTPDRIIASHIGVYWDDEAGGLCFNESQDNQLESGKSFAYRFRGDVQIPPNLGVMHFVVSLDNGLVRLISTSMPREESGSLIMKGFILTLNELRDIGYYPVTSPMFFAAESQMTPLVTGVVDSDHDLYGWANEMLNEIQLRFLPS